MSAESDEEHIKEPGKNNTIQHLPAYHSKLLLHVIESINRTVELKELLKKCMEAASVVMDSEASSLMLLDEQTGELNVSIPTGPVQDDITGISIPKDKGVGGWVLKNNESYLCNDISKSEFFWKDISDDFKTRNIICVPLKTTSHKPFGVVQAINKQHGADFTEEDITVFESLAMHMAIALERAQKYEVMLDKLEDREVQLSEIHHRLKNNLATICALIELDIDDMSEEKSKQALKATGSRIRSVSDVHSLLYDHANLGVLELAGYLKSVISNVERIFFEPGKKITVTADLESVVLEANKAMITGLIVNELLINAYQHAFKGKNSGQIDVQLKNLDENKILVHVSDNGIGKKTEENTEKKSHGTFIIKALSRKLNAELESSMDEETGSDFKLIFTK